VPAAELTSQPVKEFPVTGNKPIDGARDGSKTGDASITPQEPLFLRDRGERAKDSLRAAPHLALLIDQLRCRLESSQRNFGKLAGNLLIGCVRDPAACDALPIFDPELAEGAVSIVDEERSLPRAERGHGFSLDHNPSPLRHPSTSEMCYHPNRRCACWGPRCWGPRFRG
jgi:hypothetical protein